jgi:hypothetical protein
MIIAIKLGLDPEIFCRMCLTTKMLLSNVIGHAAELHYEKYLIKNNLNFQKANTDEHFDYLVTGFRDQVKRFETESTNFNRIGVNLTQTHGDRSGQDAFYKLDSFDRLVIFDVGFENHHLIPIEDLPRHAKFSTHIDGKFKTLRSASLLSDFNKEFLSVMKVKNQGFPQAIEIFREKFNLGYSELLEKICNLSLTEIDSLFSTDNFRLVTGAKGFAAEEHFNVFLEKNGFNYRQDKDMYSKVDHWIGDLRVQVKIPNQRAVDANNWAFKTHKSHGSGVGELYENNAFDVVALFIGFEIDEDIDRYFPISVKNEFLFIPMKDIDEHPKYPGYLKRVTRFAKEKYKINDVTLLKS